MSFLKEFQSKARLFLVVGILTIFIGGVLWLPNDSKAISFLPYTPFKITIEKVEGSSSLLRVERNEESLLLSKDGKLILVIPQYSEFGDEGITFRHRERSYGAEEVPNIIELESESSDIHLCHFINPYQENQEYKCEQKIKTNIAEIDVKYSGNFEQLAETAGVAGKDVKTALLEFILNGKIDGEPFTVEGRIVYDNTEESRAQYRERIRDATEAWERMNRIEGAISSPLNLVLVIGLAIVLLLGSTFVVRKLKNK